MITRLKTRYHQFRFACKVNWVKTVWFNFKKFPFSTAKRLPVYFYGPVKFQSIRGEIEITAPIRRGMIAFGMQYEMDRARRKTAEIALYGKVTFHGYTQFGKDVFLYVGKQAHAEFGAMTGLASRSQFICTTHIKLDDYARIGDDCKLVDTDFHQMMHTETKEKYPLTAPIHIGKYNAIGSQVTLAKGTITPNYCTVAANSLCTKNYRSLGENSLIGGVPAKLLKQNYTRDWDGEAAMMEQLILR